VKTGEPAYFMIMPRRTKDVTSIAGCIYCSQGVSSNTNRLFPIRSLWPIAARREDSQLKT